MRSFAFFLVAALAGCSGPATRAVSGQLRVDTSAMSHPVVIAQSSDHRVFVAKMSASGRFTLMLPANTSYRMSLASTSGSGVYSTRARINWPLASGASRWATLGSGGAINLGNVYQRGTRPSGLSTSCDSCMGQQGDDPGDDDDQGCDEEDDACQSHDGDVDDDCDHQVSTGDHCDQDDDADEHDQDADEDDDGMCHADGGGATGGGGAGGGGGGGAGGGGGGGGVGVP